jgi:hypothetical protein
MTTRTWKRFLMGATAAAALSVPGAALADPTCAYVFGQVNSVTVATPALVVFVPASGADIQPIRVHVDEEDHSIVGYSLRTPGVDQGVDPRAIFVPSIEYTINPIVATIPQLTVATSTCLNFEASTPAVPVHIPASVLNIPGAFVDVPAISLNILGRPVTTPGKIIIYEGKTIVIPAFDAVVPGVSAGTPAESITVDVNGTLKSARYLAPTN